MKKFSNMKLSRYTEVLLEANDILKIAQHMHQNRDTLPEIFNTGTELEVLQRSNMTRALAPMTAGRVLLGDVEATKEVPKEDFYEVFRFSTGAKKTVYDYDDEGKKVEGSEREEDVTSTVDIFSTSNERKKATRVVNIDGHVTSISFSTDDRLNYKYMWLDTKSHKPTTQDYALKYFDEYSTPENLNREAWLFRSMSIDVQLIVSYLMKHNCPGIDLYFIDVPQLLEKLGLQKSTVQDIKELQE